MIQPSHWLTRSPPSPSCPSIMQPLRTLRGRVGLSIDLTGVLGLFDNGLVCCVALPLAVIESCGGFRGTDSGLVVVCKGAY